MDSNRIKNVALGARTALMQEVDAALERVLAPDSPERVANSQAVGTIERTVRDRGRETVVEQVAYTWFNRLCALRYMDVRGYTPVGLVSPRAGETLPAVLADARRGIYAAGLDISQRDKNSINSVLSGGTADRDPLGRAYVMLLVAACKTYERSMDYLFGAGRDLGPAIELLAPTDLLSEGSLLQRICAGLDEATCNEGVEVMGWLYQFYVSERKDAFFASKKKATAADIAPATQLFTPNWIVRYLVENSLGRLWMLNFPDSELKEHMDYYVEPEEPEDDAACHPERAKRVEGSPTSRAEETFLKIYSPEDITFLDPACGSGHILVYAFDLLYLMYEEEGYRPADIPALILKNNLTGIEIDDRAAEIASFCLEMKALERDPGFLQKDCDAHIVVTRKFDPSEEERQLIPWFFADAVASSDLSHFDEIGSLYVPPSGFNTSIEKAFSDISENGTMSASRLRVSLAELQKSAAVLESNYSIVVTNPPYRSSGGVNAWLADWMKQNYSDVKSDLCTCFIERCLKLTLDGGLSALITASSWMFITSYENMRKKLIRNTTILSMIQQSTHGYPNVTVPTCMFVLARKKYPIRGAFIRLEDFDRPQWQQPRAFEAIHNPNCGWFYYADQDVFKALPGWQIAYWASPSLITTFETSGTLGELADVKKGMSTGENARFVRLWHEIGRSTFATDISSHEESLHSHRKWVPYNKGGAFRKWYGNNVEVLNWQHDGEELKAFNRAVLRNQPYYFRPCVTWSALSSGQINFRYKTTGGIHDGAGASFFEKRVPLYYLMAALNSSAITDVAKIISPTLNFEIGQVATYPIPEPSTEEIYAICETVALNIDITREDWDAFETSWDFIWHPLVPSHYECVEQHTYNMYAAERQAGVERIETRFQRWERDCRSRFDQLKANEEELNRIFARIYGTEGEVPIEVPDDKVSVRLADLGRDIRSLISYGVGCMFGRYSLDEPGLILADEGSTLDDYHAKVPNPTFEPDRTGILPLTDADTEWFEDDIVAQFRRWLAAAYGQDTLDENVAFIERALGKSLRAYFVRDFYDDHLKTYQKRPIYWLFQSPKKGLSALVYLHRYNPNTVTTLLTEYIRPLREQMEAQARLLEVTGNARDASTATKYRVTIDELDKWEHDVIFPLSQKHVSLSLDDGVKANYGRPEFKGALRKVAGLS